MRDLVRLASVFLVACALSAPPAFGSESQSFTQSPEAVSIRGRVLDPRHAPIMGALVTARVRNSKSAPSATTDARGEFSLWLPRGDYTLMVTADGFVEASQQIGADGAGDLHEFVLQIAGVRESVSVTAPRGYDVAAIGSATKTFTPARDVPQSISVVTQELVKDQLMSGIADVVRYMPGVSAHQGENNRDDVVIRGNRSSADFFLNGVRDDVQYYRDLYNLDRVEALKGPNAMIFGRGGGGGVINRVVKEAGFEPLRDVAVQVGAHDRKRFTADVGQPLTETLAVRVNGMAESSDSFRDGVELERTGINPTLTYFLGTRTKATVGYEYLRDTRVADRGITSFRGRPADVDPATFYGNPDDSHVRARVNLGSALIEHQAGGLTIRNRTMAGWYDRFYQNFVPGAVTADGSQVTLTSYNNATTRTNVFNQTDVTFKADTGSIRHTLLAGSEFGRQRSENLRNSGFFNGSAATLLVPFSNPTIHVPVTFRQSATDADNHVRATIAAAFAQDQLELTPYLHLIGGVRFERFDLQYHNNRNGETLSRADHLVSPRGGIVFKPVAPLSVYGSYSVSYLPSSGDQFASLTAVTEQMKPEKFDNYEVGLKWDLRPALSVTTAAYRLDRTNTRSTDPNDPTRIVQTGSQRTEGFELGINGQIASGWQIAGGYAYQDALVTRATAAARAGAEVGQVPRHTLSIWNNYRVHPRVGLGLGVIHRSDMFGTVDNTVVLPAYTRVDGAAFFDVRDGLRLQMNIENLFDAKYFVNADSNTNISPGGPRSLRFALAVRF